MRITSEPTKRAQGDARETRRADGEGRLRKAQLLFHFVRWERLRGRCEPTETTFQREWAVGRLMHLRY